MKLFIVVRNDLKPGLQAAQAVHAKELFSREHPELNDKWYERSNNVVVLQVPDCAALIDLKGRLCRQKVTLSVFEEPDLGNAPTALACSDGAEHLLSSLALALRDAKTLPRGAILCLPAAPG